MRKIFRFGLHTPADAFILVTILETVFALIYVLLDGTEFFTAGLHLSTASQNILVPPMAKWLVSLLRFTSTALLWAHLFKSVPKLALRLWVLIGLVHDLLCPAWIIVQDVLNKPVPDSSYPPLYRIVLLLSFRFYVYYFMYKFSQEMPPPEEDDKITTSRGGRLLWCATSGHGSSSSSFEYSNPSLEDDDGKPASESEPTTQAQAEPPPSPTKKSVQFDPEPHTIEDSYPDDVTPSKGESSSSTTASSDDHLPPQDPVAIEFSHLLHSWSQDLDAMARLVRLLLIIEIVWNAYVLLIHEIRFGMAAQSRRRGSGRSTGQRLPGPDEDPAAGRIFSINETVTLEMIWIRLGFVAISVLGLFLLRVQRVKFASLGVAIGYLILVGVNLAHVIRIQKWEALSADQNSINLTLTVFFIGANAMLKSCVGYVLLRFGISRAARGRSRDRYVIDNQIEIVTRANSESNYGPGGRRGKKDDQNVELVFVINRERDGDGDRGSESPIQAAAVAVAEATRIRQFTEL